MSNLDTVPHVGPFLQKLVVGAEVVTLFYIVQAQFNFNYFWFFFVFWTEEKISLVLLLQYYVLLLPYNYAS